MTLILSCKNENTEAAFTDEEMKVEKELVDLPQYLDGLKDVLTAHGGLQKWSEMKSMTYVMDDQETVTDLKTRDIIIKAPTHTIGF